MARLIRYASWRSLLFNVAASKIKDEWIAALQQVLYGTMSSRSLRSPSFSINPLHCTGSAPDSRKPIAELLQEKSSDTSHTDGVKDSHAVFEGFLDLVCFGYVTVIE